MIIHSVKCPFFYSSFSSKSSWCMENNIQCSKKLNKFRPPTSSDDLYILFLCLYTSSMIYMYLLHSALYLKYNWIWVGICIIQETFPLVKKCCLLKGVFNELASKSFLRRSRPNQLRTNSKGMTYIFLIFSTPNPHNSLFFFARVRVACGVRRNTYSVTLCGIQFALPTFPLCGLATVVFQIFLL